MPSFTITLEDTSPLIRYSSNWSAGSAGDNQLDQYSEKSFMLTQKQGEAMSLDYYGTDVTVFGAKRFNHGKYQAQLDGGSVSTVNGVSSDALFNQVMYKSSGASLGKHTVTVTNGENLFFDVDYITFQTNIGQDGEELIVNTFQDNHPSFTYSPSSSWGQPGDRVGWFSGSTGRLTTDASAIAKFLFQVRWESCEAVWMKANQITGDAIALYGSVGPSATDKYSVQIDNQSPTVYSAKSQFYKPQEVLYYAGNLGTGNHTLQIQITSSSLGELAIDYADVYSTQSLGGSFQFSSAGSGTTTGTGSTSVTVKSTPKGVIAGLAVTSAIALIATLACMYLLWRQRRNDSFTEKQAAALPSSSNMAQNNQIYAPTNVSASATGSNYPIVNVGSSYALSGPPSNTAASNASFATGTSPSTPYTSGYLPQGKRNLEMSRNLAAEGEIPMAPPQYTMG